MPLGHGASSRAADPSAGPSSAELPHASALEARFGLFNDAHDAHQPLPGTDGAVRCSCERCVAWCEFVKSTPARMGQQYEVFTQELVQHLARTLRMLRAELGSELRGRALRVLELGAGTGRLAHELRKALAAASLPSTGGDLAPAAGGEDSDGAGAGEDILIIASDLDPRPRPPPAAAAPRAGSRDDSGSSDGGSAEDEREEREGSEGGRGRNGAGLPARYPVMAADYKDALSRCLPDLVLVCWMPLGHDWTAAVRACRSVRALLLLGDTTGILCGQPGATWGRARPADSGAPIAPRTHGWFTRELGHVSAIQLCMVDAPWCNVRHSRTVLAARDERVATRVAAAMSGDDR
jgi:hypothetical protein